MSVRVRYTREELIELCEAAVVPMDKWHDRDSASAQRNIGEAWVLLKAGCPFTVDKTMTRDADTIWVEIRCQGFNHFEYGDNTGPYASEYGEGDNYDETTRYIPTRKRLDARKGEDWY